MALQTESRLVNGTEWQVTQWPARHSFKMKTRLAKLAGPSLGRVLSAATSGKGLDGEIDMTGVIDSLVERLDENDTLKLVMDMLDGVRLDGKEAQREFDQHFAGNFAELYQGLGFVLEVNYGDFTDRIRDAITSLVQQQSGSGESA